MSNNKCLQSLLLVAIITIFLLGAFSSTYAQKTDYKPGEKIEYKPNQYMDVWEEGTFVRVSEYSSQPLILGKREGSTVTGSQWESIRPLTVKKPAVNTQDKQKANAETKYTAGTGLMTKEEIIGYMRAHGYANGKPKIDPQICKDLIEEIKRRGVKEPFQPGDDVSSFRENGCSYYIEDAALNNVGTPTTINWLSGTWLLIKIGGTVDTRPGDGYIHRKNETIANTGFITVNGNSTYIWKVNPTDPPAKYIKGTWRKATDEEMKQQGGAGIVLQKGQDAADWIVFKYMLWKGDNIEVEHLQQRGWNRFIGSRQ